MTNNIRYVKFNGTIYAIIIPAQYSSDRLEFITPDEYSQQLAYMNRPKDSKVQEHIHTKIERKIKDTMEVLIFRKGKARIDLYSQEKKYLGSEKVQAGDIVLLVRGGHGIEFEEDTEMIEVKQGPYYGAKEKEKFERRSEYDSS